jgi:hypothetical protein
VKNDRRTGFASGARWAHRSALVACFVSAPMAHADLVQMPPVRDLSVFWSQTGTLLQWWYLTGPLWIGDQCDGVTGWSTIAPHQADFGSQLTFFYRGSGEQQGFVMHGALANMSENAHEHVSHFETWSSGQTSGLFGYARNEGVGQGPELKIGNHELVALTAPLQSRATVAPWLASWQTKRYEVRLLLDVDFRRVWAHGRWGVVQKTASTANTYVSIPFITARGFVRDRQSSQSSPVCGSLWFDHEIDVQAVESTNWQWFALRFPSGQAYMIYRITDTSGKKPFVRVVGESFQLSKADAQQGAPRAGELKNVTIEDGPAVCLKSQNCYPQSFVIRFVEDGVPRVLRLASRFPEQEVDTGLVKSYWEGLVDVSDESGTKGLGYVELTK